MMGMEKMLASMLGLTPEELQATANRIKTGLEVTAQTLIDISEKQDKIIAMLERHENGGSNNSDSERAEPARIGTSGSDGT